MVRKKEASIYTWQFILLCLSSLLFSASFNMIIPELPDYLSSLGGAQHKGLIIALFTLTAGISRPFSGKLTDKWGRVPVMAVGSLVCFVCGFLYPILTSVAGFFLLRLIHGFSTGFKPTATAAYIADIIPSNRWGEAVGMHGLCFALGGSIGPSIGSTVALHFGLNTLFYVSSAFALLSIVIVMYMKETLKEKESFSLAMMKISRSDIIDMRVIPAGIITLLTYTAYGTILTLIPDWSGYLDIKNKGLFFTTFTLASIGIRFVSGKVADRYGRTKVITVGLIITISSLLFVSIASSVERLILSACLYGIGTGVLSPAVNAWTIDLSHPQFRGRAMATMYIALEAGIGMGALISGYLYQDVITRVPKLFFYNAFILILALSYILIYQIRQRKNMVSSS
ncbi:MAG TPA: MFS transporter [Candidatus Sphingobacterium stercoripullorum]|uniref:MFS transporter n=1 Tax=Candidatus Sphingobacterium stercoripullorum TaxID=2838759 RepID=A0A9D1W731_9SPHI|nr:MFS transporter [Candidatus Sphingobacterium stercoripullorum]HLR50644.1 MFS transporter [Candidatus Sphingobacterium stercoripullorum]